MVNLPRFFDIIKLLRGRKFATVIDFSNCYRQWQITMDSYADYAYCIDDFIFC